MTTLASLAAALLRDVPAYQSIPSSPQADQCVKDAIADFNRRAGARKVVLLNVVAGTATYDLPADFKKLIKLSSIFNPTGVIPASTGLIPVDVGLWRERTTIQGLKLTFYPTPTYTLTRELWYKAGHVATDGDYTTLTDDEEIALVLTAAKSKALTLQADYAARQAWNYSLGDESVNKTALVQAFRDQAKEQWTAYLEGIRARVGPVGMRHQVLPGEEGSFTGGV